RGRINQRGEYYQVAGPLNLPRCPQGRPVLVQAGSSDTGRRFAARHAEAVFTAHMEKATAQAFYADLKALVAAEGRVPDEVLILPGLSPMIASTEAEAQRLAREGNELSGPGVRGKRLRRPPRRFRFLAPPPRPSAHAGGLSAALFGRSRAQPPRSDLKPGAAGEADAAAIARKPRGRAGAFHRRGHA